VVDWGLGSYERIAAQVLPAADVVVDRAAPSEGEVIVDLGCGTGNAAILAAERGARVIGVDPAERLLEVAAAEARRRDLELELVVGEAASMPLADGIADVVVSVFGVIFAPDPVEAAAEIARICSARGRVVISAWIPAGPIFAAARMFGETIAEVTAAPGDERFPWHEPSALDDLFGPYGFSVRTDEQALAFAADSPRSYVETDGRHHPMVVATLPLLERAGRADELEERLVRHYETANEDPGAFRVTSRYVVAELRR
jgi:SAM-dependent methyltransferase